MHRLLMGTTLLVAAACGGGGSAAVAPVAVTPSLTIAVPRVVATAATLPATAVVVPSGAVTWSSDAPGVATIAADGQITGVAPGSTTIRATSGSLTQTATVSVIERFADFSLGAFSGCALTAAKVLYCWGANYSGEIGFTQVPDSCVGTAECSLFPRVAPPTLTFVQISARLRTRCGLTAGGDAYCWGSNLELHLGPSGTCGSPPTGCTKTAIPALGGLQFTSVSAGAEFACALTSAGAAYCWGINWSNNIGATTSGTCGAYSCTLTPLAVSGGLVLHGLSVGARHVCALTATGAAYCWGANPNGEVGNAATSALGVATPAAVSGGLQFTAISAGTTHTCALTAAGQAWCWGSNNFGKLGDGTVNTSAVPVAVTGGLAFTSIAEGDDHTCALTAAGLAYCWGYNGGASLAGGYLGDGTNTERHAPTAVARGIAFAQLGVSRNRSCGRTAGGAMYCWGPNIFGQLGVGDSRVESLTPAGIGVP